ncbi:MAG: QueT transporter family protein [Clostridiales bacterium]|nr:QueT transporter family protein [Clostridiales bacterium]
MKNFFSTRRLCRAGVISALYVVLTYVFAPVAFGPLQIRPAEALCILPLFYGEAIPALFVGCALSNLISQYSVFDVLFGSLATLLAALGTYFMGRIFKKHPIRITLGGIFPVLLNALIIPVVIVIIFGDTGNYSSAVVAYFINVVTIGATECLWVYALGAPLYFLILRLRKRKLAIFL